MDMKYTIGQHPHPSMPTDPPRSSSIKNQTIQKPFILVLIILSVKVGDFYAEDRRADPFVADRAGF